MLGINTNAKVVDHPMMLLVHRLLAPVVTLATLLGTLWYYGEPASSGSNVALAVIAFLLALTIFDLPEKNQWGRVVMRRQASDILFSWLLFSTALLLVALLTDQLFRYPRKMLLTWFFVTPFVLILVESAVNQLALMMIVSRPPRKIVLAGVNDLGRALIGRINTDPYLRMTFEAAFDDRASSRVGPIGVDKLKGRLGDLPAYVNAHHIDAIFVTLPMTHQDRILNLLDQLRDTTASIYFVPDIFVFDLIQARAEDVDGLLAVAVCDTPFYGVNAVLKRGSDIVISTLILTLTFPLMILIALGVKLGSPGPAIFKQRRYGVDGKEIVVYKFRSMKVCEDGQQVYQAKKDDPRVTRFGAFLRRTSLDELPQFINVLQGRMSVVGPRPHAVAHNEMYRKLVKGYMIRHKVKPGITGLAQVNGLRGETETVEKMEQRIRYDLDYLRHWSLALDFKIILKTFRVVFKGNNAY